jgi:uncharacterized protein (DUF302 family)
VSWRFRPTDSSLPLAYSGSKEKEEKMVTQTTPYGIGTSVDLPYAEAVEKTRSALMAEGFGVLTEIDVAATLKKKLDVDFRPYIILGACNPPLAHQALTAEKDIGLLLPCNVIVYSEGEDRSVVAAMDPVEALGLTGNTGILPIAQEVKARLRRALESL